MKAADLEGADPTLTIRDFAPKDALALISLARELQAWEAGLHDRMKAPREIGRWYLETLLESAERHKGRLLVATLGDERPVAYCLLLTEVTSEEEFDEVPYSYALVRDIVVSEAHRGRGLGSALLARSEALAREAGARWLRIAALSDNSGALALYRRAGFTPLYTTLEKPLGE